jgi:hypothetical protein
VLGFAVNGVTQYIFTLASGSANNSIPYTFTELDQVSVFVFTVGCSTNEINFVVRDPAGSVVFQRNSGTKFTQSTPLGTFCVECSPPASVHPST